MVVEFFGQPLKASSIMAFGKFLRSSYRRCTLATHVSAARLRPRSLQLNKLDGTIPMFLLRQYKLKEIDLTSNNLSASFPSWLLTNNSHLTALDLANNSFVGHLHIPPTANFNLVIFLDISSNKFQGKVPEDIGSKFSELRLLNMSGNHFEGHIPSSVASMSKLNFLDLSNNHFSGQYPNIMFRHFHSNRFTGTIPSVLSSRSGLQTLDLRDNQLVGVIPFWIGKLSSLSILLLAGNSLHGQIPYQICQLVHINILDLSRNNLFGNIPACFVNMPFGLKGLDVCSTSIGEGIGEETSYLYAKREVVEFLEKNQYRPYSGGVLQLMSGLDLSCNKLTGIIPLEFGKLSKLHSLNFSHNHLTGSIPSSFSQLNQLESLDLSSNNLSGRIPSQLVELTFLVGFNVSFNSLTGRVPEGGQFSNFDERNYLGNPGLSGFLASHENTALSPDNDPSEGDGEKDYAESLTVDFLWSFGMSCTMMFIAIIIYINPRNGVNLCLILFNGNSHFNLCPEVLMNVLMYSVKSFDN